MRPVSIAAGAIEQVQHHRADGIQEKEGFDKIKEPDLPLRRALRPPGGCLARLRDRRGRESYAAYRNAFEQLSTLRILLILDAVSV